MSTTNGRGDFISTTLSPEQFARAALDDIEAATAEAFEALDEWDTDRLRRAFADIAAHVQAWERGPVTDRTNRSEETR